MGAAGYRHAMGNTGVHSDTWRHVLWQVDQIKRYAITGRPDRDLNRQIVDRIPERAKFVLIGEASHGTKDFYDQVATARLRDVLTGRILEGSQQLQGWALGRAER
jgi:hypothetical protein